MATATLPDDFVAVSEELQPALRKVEQVLAEAGDGPHCLVGPDGGQALLPASLTQVLRQAVQMLQRGQTVLLLPVAKELTTNQAADLLNVSRPYLIGLLDKSEIPYKKTGTHRRIGFANLMEYKQRRDTERHRGIERLAELTQELGMYD